MILSDIIPNMSGSAVRKCVLKLSHCKYAMHSRLEFVNVVFAWCTCLDKVYTLTDSNSIVSCLVIDLYEILHSASNPALLTGLSSRSIGVSSCSSISRSMISSCMMLHAKIRPSATGLLAEWLRKVSHGCFVWSPLNKSFPSQFLMGVVLSWPLRSILVQDLRWSSGGIPCITPSTNSECRLSYKLHSTIYLYLIGNLILSLVKPVSVSESNWVEAFTIIWTAVSTRLYKVAVRLGGRWRAQYFPICWMQRRVSTHQHYLPGSLGAVIWCGSFFFSSAISMLIIT